MEPEITNNIKYLLSSTSELFKEITATLKHDRTKEEETNIYVGFYELVEWHAAITELLDAALLDPKTGEILSEPPKGMTRAWYNAKERVVDSMKERISAVVFSSERLKELIRDE